MSTKGRKTYKKTLKRRVFHLSFLVVLFLFMLGTFITPVQAGILSFFGNLLNDAVKEDGFVQKNSQNMTLLTAALNLDPNPRKGGGGITIIEGIALLADAGPIAVVQEDVVKPKSDQISVYVVREGDSLSQIAQMFDVTIETILWANDVGRGGIIHGGQTLVILPTTGVQHVVKSGETLASIAKKYKADASEIAGFNDISDDYNLAIGERLVIPDGVIESRRYSRGSAGAIVKGVSGPSYEDYYISPVSLAKKSQGLHGWNAVDLAASYGSPIFAAASGKVLISRFGWNGGYGNYVVIAHSNGTQTVYAHNSENIVSAGQNVVKGQVIGYVGSTGRSTGSHVHFEVRGAKNPF